jgi:hypothetical protein
MNNLEAVNIITNSLKLNNRDDHVPGRYILRVLKNTATFLISQKWAERSIIGDLNLYTQIPCFEFESIDTRECNNVEFRRCDILMKSKCKLPKLIFSRLGASVKEIVSLDGSYRFVFLDKGQYQRNKNRRYSIEDEVYIYLDVDNYLYIPDHEIYTVDLTILTQNPEEADECSSCKKDECKKSNWEYEFIVPDKLVSTVLSEVLKLLGMSRQITEDNNPNNVPGV